MSNGCNAISVYDAVRVLFGQEGMTRKEANDKLRCLMVIFQSMHVQPKDSAGILGREIKLHESV